jgi:hypothetical protein
MQKPRFRTAEKSAWLFVTTRLHPRKTPKMNRRTAQRCGYLGTVTARTGRENLPMPLSGEAMSTYLERLGKASTR